MTRTQPHTRPTWIIRNWPTFCAAGAGVNALAVITLWLPLLLLALTVDGTALVTYTRYQKWSQR